MPIRLGDLLVTHGALTEDQRDAILAQQELIPRPFGVLAEEMFGVSPADVEHAWAVQYAAIAPMIDPMEHIIEPDLLDMVERRQAWQFGLIPMYTKDGVTMFATCTQFLARALRFVGWRFEGSCSFSICSYDDLIHGLKLHYPLEGLSDEMMHRLINRQDPGQNAA